MCIIYFGNFWTLWTILLLLTLIHFIIRHHTLNFSKVLRFTEICHMIGIWLVFMNTPCVLEISFYSTFVAFSLYKCQLGQDGWCCHLILHNLLKFVQCFWGRGIKVSRCNCEYACSSFCNLSLFILYILELLMAVYTFSIFMSSWYTNPLAL